MTYSLADARDVQARIADTILDEQSPAELGDITLLPHQRDAVSRIRAAIHTHHGALLADDVGLGKTYTALAVASSYERVHVIAPAALQSMWRTAITHAQLSGITLHSVHGFSRADDSGEAHPLSPHAVREAEPRTWRRLSTLVIIDEAHYLRTKRTARYAAVARFVSGCDTLLISATPLHNRTNELRNLLGLFLGSRADLLSDTILAQVIIRRTATNGTPDAAARTPAVIRHPPQPIPHDRATLTRILELPAPLPAHDGAVAGALIRLGLLRAWCSSDAALAHALRQRRLRGHALLQALRAGRHPTQAELRGWLVGEHEVQLAFPELMAAQTVDAAPLIELLSAHLNGLETLAEHHDRTSQGDLARADAIREVMRRHPDTPIIAFSQFTQTISALNRALSDIAGVGVLSSRHAQIASGRISRTDALARFAPIAQERPPPPPHHAIRLLLSTDLLAEGVNLQDAGVVVHLDLPWTAALREQRVGRCARLGSPHDVVHVYAFAPPPAGDRALRLQRRLAHKARLARRFIGNRRVRGARNTRSAAWGATALRALMQHWQAGSPVSEVFRYVRPSGITEVAVVRAPRRAWLAVIERHGVSLLLCGYSVAGVSGRRRVSARTRALLRVAQMVDRAPRDMRPVAAIDDATDEGVRRALQDIARWHARGEVREDSGPSAAVLSHVGQRASQQIEQIVQRCSTLQRQLLRRQIIDAQLAVQRSRGQGAEEALRRWSGSFDLLAADRPSSWLSGWREEPLLAAAMSAADSREAVNAADASSAASAASARRGDALKVNALLLLGPDWTAAGHG